MIEIQNYTYYVIKGSKHKKIEVVAMDRMEAIGRLNMELSKKTGYKKINFKEF